MKRGIAMVLTACLALGLTACAGTDPKSYVSNQIGVNCTAGTVVTDSDQHEGFLGDGVRFDVLEFSDASAQSQIKKNWKTLPLSDNLTALAYGASTKTMSVGPYLTDSDGNALLPEIKNGYYYFCDRQNDEQNASDDSKVLSRYSLNVTLAIYDTDTGRLYYCELDT